MDKSDRAALTRRGFLRASLGTAAMLATAGKVSGAAAPRAGLKLANGLAMPPVGMGTWLTFDVAVNSREFEQRKKVLDEFFAQGGGMIDSSPMYGRSERVVGELMHEREKFSQLLFSATKIWTMVDSRGPGQLENSHALWKIKPLDLVYVHNLLRWKAHLKTLRAAQDKGDVRYIGLTTSHGRRHDEMARLITSEPIDGVQFTYNILDREAENRLLPLAQDHGVAVIINRPFRGGGLFQQLAHHPLPPWSEEIGCSSWAAFFLKFIISHPAVNAAIPATTRVDHMRQNMEASKAFNLEQSVRRKMIRYVESL